MVQRIDGWIVRNYNTANTISRANITQRILFIAHGDKLVLVNQIVDTVTAIHGSGLVTPLTFSDSARSSRGTDRQMDSSISY